VNDVGARSSSVMLKAFSGQKRRNMQRMVVMPNKSRGGKEGKCLNRAGDERTTEQFPALKDSPDASRVNANSEKNHLKLQQE
jgi:hypothetical protein